MNPSVEVIEATLIFAQDLVGRVVKEKVQVVLLQRTAPQPDVSSSVCKRVLYIQRQKQAIHEAALLSNVHGS